MRYKIMQNLLNDKLKIQKVSGDCAAILCRVSFRRGQGGALDTLVTHVVKYDSWYAVVFM